MKETCYICHQEDEIENLIELEDGVYAHPLCQEEYSSKHNEKLEI